MRYKYFSRRIKTSKEMVRKYDEELKTQIRIKGERKAKYKWESNQDVDRGSKIKDRGEEKIRIKREQNRKKSSKVTKIWNVFAQTDLLLTCLTRLLLSFDEWSQSWHINVLSTFLMKFFAFWPLIKTETKSKCFHFLKGSSRIRQISNGMSSCCSWAKYNKCW